MLLTEHLSKFSLLPVHQSAYRANHSTETALLYLFDDLLTTADQKDASALVLLDLSAAFDTIDYQILLERLSHCFGLSGTAVNWFSSYLSNRTQSVQVGAYTSDVVHLLFGVAQGSALGGPVSAKTHYILILIIWQQSPLLFPSFLSLSIFFMEHFVSASLAWSL